MYLDHVDTGDVEAVSFITPSASATAKPACSRLQGNKECCLLKEKSIITGVE